jgi:EAL domain-containing protein (putative c-di-GMP-specific phosphodiesterase class I)/GGDEF domain-containing protein
MWSCGALREHGRAAHIVLSGIDVTEQREAQNAAHYLGHFDPVTGLPNRQLFVQELETHCAARERETATTLLLLLVGLRRLSDIADSDGPEAVTRLCVAMAERLRELKQDNAFLARLSDNTFAFAAELPNKTEADRLARHVLDEMGAPIALGAREQTVPVFGGLALLPEHARDAQQLVRAAEAALHRAEVDLAPVAPYAVYSPTLPDRARERLQLESELRVALATDDQLVLYYQPQIDVRSGKVIGLEALIRWRHPRLALLGPGQFIPLAEVCGLMNELGNWVMSAACRQIAQWDAQGVRAPLVAVNLCASHFASPALLADIDRHLSRHDTGADRIELELTESMSMRDPIASVAIMQALRERGLTIAIDDFGTGYSNLSYLKRFPVNRLKLDQAFVRDIVCDADDQAISRAIIAMAHQLRLEVVAEGIETRAQYDLLASVDCDIAQGYLLSAPLDADSCAELLARPGAHAMQAWSHAAPAASVAHGMS